MSKQYKDVSSSFKANPFTGEPSVVKDERAVAESLKNIILTDTGERPFQPDLAGNVRALLFEPVSPIVFDSLKTRIEDVVDNFEPRVSLQEVAVDYQVDQNRFSVTIKYKVVSLPGVFTTEIKLQRLT